MCPPPSQVMSTSSLAGSQRGGSESVTLNRETRAPSGRGSPSLAASV